MIQILHEDLSMSLQIVCERTDILASACAIARAFPIYTRKSSGNGVKRTVTVEFLVVGPECTLSESDITCVSDAAYGVRMAARLTDTPCAEMHTDAFIEVGFKLTRPPSVNEMFLIVCVFFSHVDK